MNRKEEEITQERYIHIPWHGLIIWTGRANNALILEQWKQNTVIEEKIW